jgi:hypothetical protein
LTGGPDHDPAPSVELRSWYMAQLRPRMVRAARLGLVDAGRVLALDIELRALIGNEPVLPSNGSQPEDRPRADAA